MTKTEDSTSEASTSSGKEVKQLESGGMKREMGLLAAVNVIFGVMIGSGIFISPVAAFKYSGSVGMCLVVWAVCGVISLLGALCFAELGKIRIYP